MVTSVFWIVYASLIVCIAGLAALSLYVLQSALRKSYAAQTKELREWVEASQRKFQHIVLEEMDKRLEARIQEFESRLTEASNKRIAAIANKMAAFSDTQGKKLLEEIEAGNNRLLRRMEQNAQSGNGRTHSSMTVPPQAY